MYYVLRQKISSTGKEKLVFYFYSQLSTGTKSSSHLLSSMLYKNYATTWITVIVAGNIHNWFWRMCKRTKHYHFELTYSGFSGNHKMKGLVYTSFMLRWPKYKIHPLILPLITTHEGCAACDIQEGKWLFFFYLQFSVYASPDKISSPLMVFKSISNTGWYTTHLFSNVFWTFKLELSRIRIFPENCGSEKIILFNFKNFRFGLYQEI